MKKVTIYSNIGKIVAEVKEVEVVYSGYDSNVILSEDGGYLIEDSSSFQGRVYIAKEKNSYGCYPILEQNCDIRIKEIY